MMLVIVANAKNAIQKINHRVDNQINLIEQKEEYILSIPLFKIMLNLMLPYNQNRLF